MSDDDLFAEALKRGLVRRDGGKLRVLRQPEDDMVQCPACGGQGVVKKWPGDRSPDRDCATCDGVGGVTEDQCEAYHDRFRG